MPDELDLRLTQALETAPEVHIPANFAATLMSRVPHPQRLHRLGRAEAAQFSTPRIALWTTRAACALLLLAMFLFTPWALNRSTAALTLEFLLAAEFIALAIWTSFHPQTLFGTPE